MILIAEWISVEQRNGIVPTVTEARQRKMAKAHVLLVGLDPDIVDYSKSPVPGLTAAKVRAALESDKAKLETLGHSVKSLYVDDGKTAESALTAELTSSQYDCIMVGAGLH